MGCLTVPFRIIFSLILIAGGAGSIFQTTEPLFFLFCLALILFGLGFLINTWGDGGTLLELLGAAIGTGVAAVEGFRQESYVAGVLISIVSVAFFLISLAVIRGYFHSDSSAQ
ncbi:hypothetical protein GKZ89_09940 [Bacillus mangrovi]|uniref:Uncharacterized protein n=1 Tax=Metabacillus mangrovi TaxID=1491830 RepID=A0A7X2S4X7_9BACI|nr:hypothetical protein [Metabacillus mangrovi]MTH53724.1 hypothetical protein [Metabacillus mangrovi]